MSSPSDDRLPSSLSIPGSFLVKAVKNDFLFKIFGWLGVLVLINGSSNSSFVLRSVPESNFLIICAKFSGAFFTSVIS